jgi:hypothetical protein
MSKRLNDARYSQMLNKVLLQPWFLPKRAANAIRSIVPPDFWKKMRHLFDDYGCIICERRSEYLGNGMCRRCYTLVRARLVASVKRRKQSNPHERLDLEVFNQRALARKLLRKFSLSRKNRQPPTSYTIQSGLRDLMHPQLFPPIKVNSGKDILRSGNNYFSSNGRTLETSATTAVSAIAAACSSASCAERPKPRTPI